MAANNTTAQSQIAIMLQVVEDTVATSQNLDEGIDRRFQMATAADMGTEKYRHPINFDVGGQLGGYQPDGGPYFTGTGPEYNQFVVVPVPMMIACGATELLERIEKANGLEVVKPITKMISMVKKKMAHSRNALAQDYNEGNLGSIDATYAGGTVIQMANVPYGNRLLDLNNTYQITDANYNVVGPATVIDKSVSTGGTIDTVTVDALPGALVAGGHFIPINFASGNPLGPQGMTYLISTSIAGDLDGISRAVSQMQAPGVNCNQATLSLGVIEAMNVRQNQALGSDQEDEKRFYYTHRIQQTTAKLLGFAKLMITSSDGRQPNFDMSPGRQDKWRIGDQEVLTDSMAGISTLYDVAGAHLRKVRYPGSQKFLPGVLMGLWWPRYTAQGQATSERDILYQDAYNFYTNLVWCHALAENVGISPMLTAAA